MGKEVKIIIKSKNILELQEDAQAGDFIDLNNAIEVDSTPILERINLKENHIFNERLNEEKQRLISEIELKYRTSNLEDLNKIKDEYQNRINELELAISNKNQQVELEKEKLLHEKTLEVSEYKKEIQILKENLKNKDQELIDKLELESVKTSRDYQEKIYNYESSINSLNEKIASLSKEKEDQLKLQEYKIQQEFNEKISTLEKELSEVRLTKSILSTKGLGEDLEKWCQSEYDAYSLGAFHNCKFYKDNEAIKEEDEEKGTKADYIFEIYSSEEKEDAHLLTSVCLEMKNEGVNTKNHHKNSEFYAKLEKDRIKKNCEYSLLVSNLELDQENSVLIKRVSDYKNMYMVRPQYFITFLSLLNSLTLKYKDLINEKIKEEEDFKDKQEIIDEFEKFKETYLDKPLETLNKKVASILNEAKKCESSSQAIIKTANEIIFETIETMKQKIERFNILRVGKKLDKLDKKTSIDE